MGGVGWGGYERVRQRREYCSDEGRADIRQVTYEQGWTADFTDLLFRKWRKSSDLWHCGSSSPAGIVATTPRGRDPYASPTDSCLDHAERDHSSALLRTAFRQHREDWKA